MGNLPEINEEDAFHIIVRHLRDGRRPDDASSYGYDLYIPAVIYRYLRSDMGVLQPYNTQLVEELSPHFYAAAWELCRRGIVRPGVRAHGQQVTNDGSGGNGYSITPSGRRWLLEAGGYEYVPIQPGRFAGILDSFTPKLGQTFRDRSQEAIKCYNALAYLACCAMCGAAAESIILTLAIEKTKDRDKILRDYESAGGRGRVENLLIGQQQKAFQEEFRGLSSLLKYWRDASSHGKRSGIGDNEAYTSLAMLLRFAQFSTDKWLDLTRSK